MEHVRLATLADAKEIAAIYAPFVADTHVSFEEVPPHPDAMRERLVAIERARRIDFPSIRAHTLPMRIAGRGSAARCTPR